jgi:hypothetical protein
MLSEKVKQELADWVLFGSRVKEEPVYCYVENEFTDHWDLTASFNPCLSGKHRFVVTDSRFYPGIFEFITNLACTRHCAECIRTPLRYHFERYELTIDELSDCLQCLVSLDRVLPIVRLCGGDTLSWSCLPEAVSLLRRSKNIRKLEVVLAPRETDVPYLLEMFNSFDRIFISRRPDNKEILPYLSEQLGNKLSLWGSLKHVIQPKQGISDSVPGICGVPMPTYFNGRVWQCPNFSSLWFKRKAEIQPENLTQYSRSFYEEMEHPLKTWSWGLLRGICDLCIDNKLVRNRLPQANL